MKERVIVTAEKLSAEAFFLISLFINNKNTMKSGRGGSGKIMRLFFFVAILVTIVMVAAERQTLRFPAVQYDVLSHNPVCLKGRLYDAV
ncbi:hypothetical protein [Pelodictyon luteolum]|uniref:hypothetical protein n=1 Tax=Pelodictyon luteolum TaxID=1100 RepID=UPI00059E32D2|nr:hypothetical protein [Pelodictyon luteolum]